MYRFLILLSAISLSFACTPAQTKFYWESPCQGQKFTNLVLVNTLVATQNGKPVDDQGGLNLTIPIDLTLGITDNYGTVKDPKIDIAIYAYQGLGSLCKWYHEPTFSALDNLDGCSIIPPDECHLIGNPTTITASINLSVLLGDFKSFVVVGDYYGLAVTVKDGDTKLSCAWAQDKVIAK